jgi:hypothetical protein
MRVFSPTDKRKRQQAKLVECANAACCNVYFDDMEDAEEWLGCEFCDRWFCPQKECLSMLEKHEPACQKKKM